MSGDTTNARVIKIALLVVLALVVFLTFLQLTFRTPEDSETIIMNSTGLSEHDRFCMGISRPPDFELKHKMLGGNSFTTAIAYSFRSEMYFAQVKDFFATHLESEGWVQTGFEEGRREAKSVYFKKNSHRITIRLMNAAGNGHGEYSFYCAKIDR